MSATIVTRCPLQASRIESVSLDDLERHLLQSPSVAHAVIFGLPTLGVLASLLADLPLFAALMTGCFLLATMLVCRKALVRCTSQALRLLVAARLVLIFVVGALLFCVTGAAWMSVVSALLLWLTADRLLGQRTLHGFASSKRQAANLADSASAKIGAIEGAIPHVSVPPLSQEKTPPGEVPADAGIRLFAHSEVADAGVTPSRRRGRARN